MRHGVIEYNNVYRTYSCAIRLVIQDALQVRYRKNYPKIRKSSQNSYETLFKQIRSTLKQYTHTCIYKKINETIYTWKK